MAQLTHVDRQGKASMVDVSAKDVTEREAVATGRISLKPETLRLVRQNQIAKGDVLSVAKIAGIMAAKNTWNIIPLCHPLQIDWIDISFELLDQPSEIRISATVNCTGKTGVEMEALTAVSVAALTIYDMCKAVDREMTIQDIKLMRKKGGRSGEYLRGENP